MTVFEFVKTRESAFDFLDDYAINKKDEIDRYKIQADTGLIKSYMLETENDYTSNLDDVQSLFTENLWRFRKLDEKMAIISIRKKDFGFIEINSSRHLVLHTIFSSADTDREVNNSVRSTPLLDHVWFPGYFLNQIWEVIIRKQLIDKVVKFRFEYKQEFDNYERINGIEELEDNDIAYDESVGSQIVYSNVVSRIDGTWDNLQEILPAFHAMKMLKLPADEIRGGYDIWDWGKVTHRSQEFRDGRSQVSWLIRNYQESTEYIERKVWLQTEKIMMRDGTESHTLSGAPVTFVFPKPLDLNIFQNFIEQVFVKSNKNFRLWGNPIYMSDNHFHVYGIDMHLWQRIYIELTPERFIVILPKGTCGNTVHRLANNIQRYLSPNVQIYIGDESYQDIITRVLMGKIYDEQ